MKLYATKMSPAISGEVSIPDEAYIIHTEYVTQKGVLLVFFGLSEDDDD